MLVCRKHTLHVRTGICFLVGKERSLSKSAGSLVHQRRYVPRDPFCRLIPLTSRPRHQYRNRHCHLRLSYPPCQATPAPKEAKDLAHRRFCPRRLVSPHTIPHHPTITHPITASASPQSSACTPSTISPLPPTSPKPTVPSPNGPPSNSTPVSSAPPCQRSRT